MRLKDESLLLPTNLKSILRFVPNLVNFTLSEGKKSEDNGITDVHSQIKLTEKLGMSLRVLNTRCLKNS